MEQLNLPYEKEAKTKARIATGIVAILVLLGLFFISFTVKDLKDDQLEEGILVNFGTSEFGDGPIQPEQVSTPTVAKQDEPKPEVNPSTAQPKQSKETVQTLKQSEETVKVPDKKNNSKKQSDVKETDNTSTDTKQSEQQEASQPEPKPTINERALYPGSRTVESGGEGVTGKPGDQGQPDGSPQPGAYEGKNSGLGDSGVGYHLRGRKLVQKPSLSDQSNAVGKITVKIKVDRNGKVLNSSLSTPTTISDNSLIQKALSAAKRAKFDKNLEAMEEQWGTMTFIFKVQ